MRTLGKRTLSSFGLALVLSIVCAFAAVVLDSFRGLFEPWRFGHYQTALKTLVELRTDEVERFRALPEGQLVAIHGIAEGVQTLRDEEAGIEVQGFLLERRHTYLFESRSTTRTGGRNPRTETRTITSWEKSASDFFSHQSWPPEVWYRFGALTELERPPGVPTPVFPGPAAEAKLWARNFARGQNDCFSSVNHDFRESERICWVVYVAQPQSYVGAKRGNTLVDWPHPDGVIYADLHNSVIDPRIEWQEQIRLGEVRNAQKRGLRYWSWQQQSGLLGILLVASVSALFLWQWLGNLWVQRARVIRKRWALPLALFGPVLMYLSYGSLPLFHGSCALWLLAPLVLWWRAAPIVPSIAVAKRAANAAAPPKSAPAPAVDAVSTARDAPDCGLELIDAWCWHSDGKSLRRAGGDDWDQVRRSRSHEGLFLCFELSDGMVVRNMDHYVEGRRDASDGMRNFIALCRDNNILTRQTAHSNCVRIGPESYQRLVETLLRDPARPRTTTPRPYSLAELMPVVQLIDAWRWSNDGLGLRPAVGEDWQKLMCTGSDGGIFVCFAMTDRVLIRSMENLQLGRAQQFKDMSELKLMCRRDNISFDAIGYQHCICLSPDHYQKLVAKLCVAAAR